MKTNKPAALAAFIALSCLATTPASAQSSPAGRWIAEQVNGAAVPRHGAPTVNLGNPSGYRGYDGCNAYSGSAQIRGATIRLEAGGATRRYCGAEQAGRTDAFYEALDKARTWRRERGRLVLVGESGGVVMRLARTR